MYVDECKYQRGDKFYSRALIRQSYREGGKIKHRTIANISQCSPQQIQAIKAGLAGNAIPIDQALTPETIPLKEGPSIGAVYVLTHLTQRLGISKALGNLRIALLVLWLVFARIIDQGSRLSAVRLSRKHAVKEILGLDNFDEDELYAALDWAADNQEHIEKQLFESRFGDVPPSLFFYDVTSSYLEGMKNELADWGYNRDKKRGKMQIVIGLLTDAQGVPIATRVFKGNTTDPQTCLNQIKTLAETFQVKDITLVGDRGMIKTAQIEDLTEAGFHYITAITKPQIETLMAKGLIQFDLFDEKIVEVQDDGVRYILRRNPDRAAELERTRRDKFATLAEKVDKSNRYLQGHSRAKVEVQLRDLQAVANKLKIASWVKLEIEARNIILSQDEAMLEKASKLDGCYVLKTDLTAQQCDARTVHDRYKDLSQVEDAFCTMKTGLLEVRPVFVRKAKRTRGHVFITMLAYAIIHEIKRLTPDLKDIPVKETIDDLSKISLVKVGVGDDLIYRIPEPVVEKQKLLEQLGVVIPGFLPRNGYQIVVNVSTTK